MLGAIYWMVRTAVLQWQSLSTTLPLLAHRLPPPFGAKLLPLPAFGRVRAVKSAAVEVPCYWNADRFRVSWTRRRPTISARPAPVNAVAYVRYTTVSAMRTCNETQETINPSPRSGTIITPGPALIRARR